MLIPTLPAPLSGSQAESCQAQGKTKEKHFHGGRLFLYPAHPLVPSKIPQVAMLSEKVPYLSLFVSGSGALGVLLK